jgi:hypothetical protein
MKLKFDKLMDVLKGADANPAGKEAPIPPDKVIDQMASDMPQRESVWWACKSADEVGPQMTPEDIEAKLAAEAWVKEPTPQNKLAAEEAAKATDFKGPGAWSAQAAAWSKNPETEATSAAAADLPPEVAQAKELMGKEASSAVAVAGAVKLAAAMKANPKEVQKALANSEPAPPGIEAEVPEMPEKPGLDLPELPEMAGQDPPPQQTKSEIKKTAKALKPFIELGKNVAEGKNTW